MPNKIITSNNYEEELQGEKIMQQNLFSKIVEVIIVVFSMVVAFLIFRNLNPESFIKPDVTPVTKAEIATAPEESYTGKIAGEDIVRISGSSDFDELIADNYATVETPEIIETGIYGLKPWVDPFEITKVRNSKGRLVSSGRKAPEVTDDVVTSVEYYQEYYLVRLQDGTYILAQFSDVYVDKITEGDMVTLPIGMKKTNSSAVKQALRDICKKYGADNTYTLYMIDNEWQQSNENLFFFIRLAIAVVVFFVLAVSLLVVFYKVRERR